MEIGNRYRLDAYQIIEHPDSRFEWVEHFGLGMQRSGECYVSDDILIIGHWQTQEAGFLMLEYTEQLNKLPEWRKTRFFCYIDSILDTTTGKKVCEIDIKHLRKSPPSVFREAVLFDDHGKRTFHLWGYRLSVSNDKNIYWEKYGGACRVYGGKALVESGILFLGPWSHQVRRQTRTEFFDELSQFPKWEKTRLWCKNQVLRDKKTFNSPCVS